MAGFVWRQSLGISTKLIKIVINMTLKEVFRVAGIFRVVITYKEPLIRWGWRF